MSSVAVIFLWLKASFDWCQMFFYMQRKPWYGKNNISSNMTDVLVLQFALKFNF